MKSPQAARISMRASARSVFHASADMSVTPLQAIPPLLRELGVEPASVFERVGIDQGVLAEASSRVPFGLVGHFLEECVAASSCPHFGLLLGIRSGPAAAGIAGKLVRHAESVRAGLRLFIAHLHLHDRGGVVALSPHGAEDVELSYVIHHPNTPGAAQILDASIAIACSVMRGLCGAQWTPSKIMLSREQPRRVGPYRSFFRAPIRFDASHSALVFPARLLDLPVAGADPAARIRLLALAAELDAARPATATELTIRALARMVIAMPPSADRVAEVLGIKPRRLRERLEAEGSSVKGLLEDLRCELARQLLEESRLPIGEIAATLHYSKPGAFSRAFKGWTGKTPQAWRKAASRRARAAQRRGGPLSSG
jgi:AraC-like DNA-binding protein